MISVLCSWHTLLEHSYVHSWTPVFLTEKTLGSSKFKNGSHDMPICGWGRGGGAVAYLCTKFEDSSFTHFKDTKENAKFRNRGDWGWLGSLTGIYNVTIWRNIRLLIHLSGKLHPCLVLFPIYRELFMESRKFFYPTCVWCPCLEWPPWNSIISLASEN